MYSKKLSIKTLAVMIALFGTGFSTSANALLDPGGSGGNAREIRIQEALEDPRVGEDAACHPDILNDLISKNTKSINESIVRSVEYGGRPTKSDAIDCYSTLMNADFSFNIPPASQIARSVFDQIKQAACRIAVDKSNQLLDSAGLNFNQDLGGQFYIPGTNESIDVDAGGLDSDFDLGASANNSGGSGQPSGGASGSADVDTSDGGISAGGSASSGGSSGDLDSFLNGIF